VRAQVEPSGSWGSASALRAELARLGYAVVEWRQLGQPVYVVLGEPPADPWQHTPIHYARR
jgi:hypothetical protein